MRPPPLARHLPPPTLSPWCARLGRPAREVLGPEAHGKEAHARTHRARRARARAGTPQRRRRRDARRQPEDALLATKERGAQAATRERAAPCQGASRPAARVAQCTLLRARRRREPGLGYVAEADRASPRSRRRPRGGGRAVRRQACDGAPPPRAHGAVRPPPPSASVRFPPPPTQPHAQPVPSVGAPSLSSREAPLLFHPSLPPFPSRPLPSYPLSAHPRHL